MRVLLTGAAGSIGRTLVSGLTDRGHRVVGLDMQPAPQGYDGSWHTADCTDPDAVAEVFDSELVDAVVHLAGIADETSLPDALTSHVISTGVLLDAMVAHGVTRMVYASSNHAVGRTPRSELGDDLLTSEAPPRPDTFYGVAKVAAEALLRLYADRHAIDTIACRIGAFLQQPESTRGLSVWLSPDDCLRMVHAALTAPAPGYVVLFGISANTRRWWDLEPGRRLGYEPSDDAEVYAADIAPSPLDEMQAAYVGGFFAADRSVVRPAVDRRA
ncbi:MAG: NAD-dependent epimerase/dehydratase family protein [Nocardioides sp.]